MTEDLKVILDANILIRAILGQTMGILKRYETDCEFFTPEHTAQEVERHIDRLTRSYRKDPDDVSRVQATLFELVNIVPLEAYQDYKAPALARIRHRDADDWHVVALSLLLDCPIWTEDGDFFGIGIATWQTRNIEIYLDAGKTLASP